MSRPSRDAPRIVATSVRGNLAVRSHLPAAAPDQAIADLSALAERLASQRMWPMAEPVRATGTWYAPQESLVVSITLPVPIDHPWTQLFHHQLSYRWGRVREYDDGWFDAGWHSVGLPRIASIEADHLVTQTINRRWM